MAATGLLLVDPIIVRLLAFNLPPLPGLTSYQFSTDGLTDLGFVALVRWFRPRPADARPLWWLFALMVVVQAGWFTLAPSAAWSAVVHWFRALPLT